jgi:hypothetical protein
LPRGNRSATVRHPSREQKRTAQAYEEKAQQLSATQRAEQLAKRQEQLARQQEQTAKEQRQLAVEQKAEAERQRSEAVTQRQRAEANLQLAMRSLDDVYLKSIGEQRLLNIPTDSLSDGPATRTRQPFSESERKLIEQGLRFYDQFVQQNAQNPQALFEAGKAYVRVAMLQVGLDQNDQAQAAYEQAITRLVE